MNRIFQKFLSFLTIVGLSSAAAVKAQHVITPRTPGTTLDLMEVSVDPTIIVSDGTMQPPN